jgi:hypothetical protein
VDDTAELDRLLETGHMPEHALHVPSRIHRNRSTADESRRTDPESSFQRSEADDSLTGRRKPRLADALGGTFSPKRPRTITTSTLSPTNTQHKPLPSIVSASDPSVHPSASLLASKPSNFQTGNTRTDTSLSSSSATQRARLEANTAANARKAAEYQPASTRKVATRRERTEKRQDLVAERQRQAPVEVRAQTFVPPRESPYEMKNRSIFGGGLSIHLPDITGLTMAVASPRKANVQYKDAEVGMPTTSLDADRKWYLFGFKSRHVS